MIVPAASFGLARLLLAVVWWYVVSGPIRTGGDLDPGIASYHFFRNLAIPTLFFLSIGISFISVDAAVACWFSAVRHGHRDVASCSADEWDPEVAPFEFVKQLL